MRAKSSPERKNLYSASRKGDELSINRDIVIKTANGVGSLNARQFKGNASQDCLSMIEIAILSFFKRH